MERKLWHGVAIASAIAGLLFMIAVGINGVLRYSLSWDFDPDLNAKLATVASSVAGALFTLTTAVLLYLTLQDQRLARVSQDEDRNYGWLSGRLEKLETNILNYRVTVVDEVKDGKTKRSERVGFAAWEQAFQYWVNTSFPSGVMAHLVLEGPIDPENFLHDQGFALRTLVELDNLIEDAKRMVLAASRRKELIRRAEDLRDRLARNKEQIASARDFLKTVIDRRDTDFPRSSYAPAMKQVIAQIEEALALLPDPKKPEYTLDAMTIRMDPEHPSVQLEATDPPTVTVERIIFHTQERKWASRVTVARLNIEMEAVDENGKQVCYQKEPFGMGLLFDPSFIRPVFDTNGSWSAEAQFNPHMPITAHRTWRVRLSMSDLHLEKDESMELTIRTDARIVKGGMFNTN
jgi:hypothetical protein